MSKKVSHKASITNQPTCGGSRKAGLAPRSTNFMMGVKRNHHFRGTPFAGKVADYPDECRGESSGSGGNGLTLGGQPLLGSKQTCRDKCLSYDKSICNRFTCRGGVCTMYDEDGKISSTWSHNGCK